MTKDLFDKAREEINEIDIKMAELFVRRMREAEIISAYKRENGLPVFDKKREEEVIARNSELVDEDVSKEYVRFIQGVMDISKDYQTRLGEKESDRIIKVNLGKRSYDIHVGKGLIYEANKIFDLNRRVLIVSDTGVPAEYAEKVKKLCLNGEIITVNQGEASKSAESFKYLCERMLEMGLTRSDCVVAVGGGVVGDLAGFAASAYMRGIDFYNIPTTLLSQVDSSIGGKTAINLGRVKNIIGAFYQPKGVIIDPDLLKTLPERQIHNGLAEVVKMALTSDEELLDIIENGSIEENIEEIIIRSLKIKKAIVEDDEREVEKRRILNFGHTLGHGIEASSNNGELYHGECVAIGMIPVCSNEVRSRLVSVLKKIGLPYEYKGNIEDALKLISHDKKCEGGQINVVFVEKPGISKIEKMDVDAFCSLVLRVFKK